MEILVNDFLLWLGDEAGFRESGLPGMSPPLLIGSEHIYLESQTAPATVFQERASLWPSGCTGRREKARGTLLFLSLGLYTAG